MKKKLVVLLIVLVVLLAGCWGEREEKVCRILGYPEVFVDSSTNPDTHYCIDLPKLGETGRVIQLPYNSTDILESITED